MEKKKRTEWTRGEKALFWVSGLLTFVVVAGIVWWQVINTTPVITVPTPTLPNPNAYDLFVQAGNQTVEGLISSGEREQIKQLGRPMTIAEKEDALKQNAAAFADLRSGFRLPYRNPPTRSFSTLFPEYAKFRSLARLLAADADVKRARGDFAGAVNSDIDAIRMGSEIPRGGTLIADLVGVACEAIGRRPIWALAPKLSAPAARSAARRLETIQSNRQPFADTLQEEKWAMQSGLAELFQKSNQLQLARELTGFGNEQSAELVRLQTRLLFTTRGRIVANQARYMDALIAQARKPYPEAKSAALPPPGDPLNDILLPVFAEAGFRDAVNKTDTALLIAVLALRAHKAEKGDYPPSLDELVRGGYLTRVPSDPFAASGPVRYKRLSAEKYLLYSVGPDSRDDNGRPFQPRQRANPNQRPTLERDSTGDYLVGVHLF